MGDVIAEIPLTIVIPEEPDPNGPNGDEPSQPGWMEGTLSYWWLIAIALVVLGAGAYLVVRYWPKGGA